MKHRGKGRARATESGKERERENKRDGGKGGSFWESLAN